MSQLSTFFLIGGEFISLPRETRAFCKFCFFSEAQTAGQQFQSALAQMPMVRADLLVSQNGTVSPYQRPNDLICQCYNDLPYFAWTIIQLRKSLSGLAKAYF
jgi:hypothetical protein